MKKNDIRAVEMVRRIRDQQATVLADKSEAQLLEFFRRAGEAARADAQQREAGLATATRGVQRVP